MKYVTLICMAGMSTSLLVNKMRRLAKEQNLDISVNAMSEAAFGRYDGPIDVLLLGPQIAYRLPELKEKPELTGIQMGVIDPEVFAAMDADTVLKKCQGGQ